MLRITGLTPPSRAFSAKRTTEMAAEIGQRRERDTLSAFFAKLGPRRIRVVTMDMWQGYIGAVKEHAPLAEIVFDRFHIERYLTQAVEEVRRQEFVRHGRPPRFGPRQEVAAPDQVPAPAPSQAPRAHGRASRAKRSRPRSVSPATIFTATVLPDSRSRAR